MTGLEHDPFPAGAEFHALAPQVAGLSSEDRGWCEALGWQWPHDETLAEWLGNVNLVVQRGSFYITPSTPSPIRILIIAAREQFYGSLNDIEPRALRKVGSTYPLQVPIGAFIATQRVLATAHIDQFKLVHAFPPVMGLDAEQTSLTLKLLQDRDLGVRELVQKMPRLVGCQPDQLRDVLENLDAEGIDAAHVIRKYPNIVTVAPQYIREKCAFFRGLGLDVPGITHSTPTVLTAARTAVSAKFDKLQAMGFDAAHLINAFPSLLNASMDSVQRRLQLCRAIARAWGWPEPATEVRQLIQGFPALLGYKLGRTRVFAQIASATLPHLPPDQLSPNTLRSVMMLKPGRVMLAYIRDRPQIREPQDLKCQAYKYRNISEAAIWALIVAEGNPTDPVIKTYLREYAQK